MGTKRREHLVLRCPACDNEHRVILTISTPEAGRLLFGGPSADDLRVQCPQTSADVEIRPRLAAGEEVLHAVVEGAPGEGQPLDDSPAAPDTSREYDEWARQSREVATKFATTMLATASGAVGVYFTTLAFVEKAAPTSVAVVVQLLPAVLFLAAVAGFALALVPRLATITAADFEAFRDQRLRQMNRALTAGAALFGLGLVSAVMVFGLVIAGR